MSGWPGPSVELCRYPRGQITVTTHRGKQTAQMFCQPKIIKSNSRKQEAAPSCGKISSTYSTNMCQQMETFSVVSNLSELSEMSTLTNVDEDFMTLKMKSNILPELHCVGLSETERHKQCMKA